MQVQSLGWEDPLEREMATHSNILAWEIPWTEEPGGLQSMGSLKSLTQLSNSATMTTTYICPLPLKPPSHATPLGHQSAPSSLCNTVLENYSWAGGPRARGLKVKDTGIAW